MRTFVASAVYVSLAAGIFAQQPNGEDPAGQVAFRNRQVRLVDSYRNSGDYPAAERVLRTWIASEPAGSASRLMIQIALADLLREEGRNAEARQLFVQSVNSPAVTSQRRLDALMGLADVDLRQGDWKTSVNEWNAALEIARFRKDTASETIGLRGLGHAWLQAGSPARAEPLLRQSLKMAESDPAAAPLEVAASLGAMAEYYRAENKLALAEDAWTRALAIERTAFGESHPQVAILMEMLSDVYSERGESGLARDYATCAADVMRQWFGEDSPASATALANLALVEQRAHTLGAAANHYETAVRVLRRSPELRPTLKIVMERYAAVLKAMHRDREAKALDTEVKAFRPN
jgi:tetratricopeptide (TPR) repeat protein